MISRRSVGLLAALAIGACAAPAADRGAGRAGGSSAKAAPVAPMLSPARYLFTDRLGVMFDEAGLAPTLPGPEPAIIDGVRFLVDHGAALATAPAVERLTGFRSLPARLGGGYVIWSAARVYRAESFLGELKPIADVGGSAGARPFLRSILLRTEAGVLSVDPTSLAVQREATPGLAEAMALDARRAVRVDALGRGSFTVDGGATWTDVLEKLSVHVTSIREGPLGELLLAGPTGAPNLRFGKEGDVDKVRDPPRTSAWMSEARTSAPLLTAFPASSRSLPGEILAQAVVAGALLPPGATPSGATPPDLAAPLPGQGSILVARENGLRLLSVATALPIADADLLNVDEKFGRCQAFSQLDAARTSTAAAGRASGRPSLSVLALCAQDAAGEVLDVRDALSRPRLEITFPEAGSYVEGPHGRLGFTGRCGPMPPSGVDLGAGTPRPGETPEEDPQGSLTAASISPPPPDEPITPDLPPADDARFCVRLSADHWIERRLRGEDARHLYRWIPGEDGKVTALLLGRDDERPQGAAKDSATDSATDSVKDRVKDRVKAAGIKEPSVIGEGVRVITVEPDDPALAGGAFPAVPAAQKEPPYQSVDADFWQDEDGSIRGWVRLPAEGETTKVEATAQGPAMRLLRVQTRRGGRTAGVRIDELGRVTQFALPDGTTEVVSGGRFGLAMAVKDEAPTYFETTDGGRTWTPVEGPPIGRIEPPSDDSAPFGCSPIGCTWASGMVRLGWGGPLPRPRPSAAAAPVFTPAANPLMRGPKPLQVTCHLDTDAPPWANDAPRDLAPPRSPGPPPKGSGVAPPIAGGAAGAVRRPPPRPDRSALGPTRPAPRPAVSPPKQGKAPMPRPLSGASGEKPRPENPSLTALPGSPPLPISLRLRGSSSLGALAAHTWSGDVWLPFQPGAAPRHLSVNDPTLTSPLGSAIPILDASPRAPVDLLLLIDKHRFRVGAPGRSFLPFDVQSSITVAADAPDGLLIALDADKGVIWISRGDATTVAIRLVRVPDAARTRLTLARRLDGRGLSLIGYSTSTGDVFAGNLDLGRAEIGPLIALGRLESIAEAERGACQGIKATHRFLAEVPSALTILGKNSRSLFDAQVTGTLLLEGNGERLCASGFEVGLSNLGKGSATDLTATFGKALNAAVRSGSRGAPGSCSLAPGK